MKWKKYRFLGLGIGLAFDLLLVLAVGLQGRFGEQCLSAVLGYAPCAAPSQALGQGVLLGLLCMSPFLVLAPVAGYRIGRRTDRHIRHSRRSSSKSVPPPLPSGWEDSLRDALSGTGALGPTDPGQAPQGNSGGPPADGATP